jgi:hypothetical protein
VPVALLLLSLLPVDDPCDELELLGPMLFPPDYFKKLLLLFWEDDVDVFVVVVDDAFPFDFLFKYISLLLLCPSLASYYWFFMRTVWEVFHVMNRLLAGCFTHGIRRGGNAGDADNLRNNLDIVLSIV